MPRIVIIGAGVTGLSAAYHLEKKGVFDYILLEKKPTIGGLCGSVIQDGFTFDHCGHLLHINDSYFKKFIEEVVGFNTFTKVKRKSYIYSHDCYTLYPYQVNLRGLPPTIISECIKGFVERPTKNIAGVKKESFRSWTLKNFGYGFTKHFFDPYQKKIFCHSIDEITDSWTSRFVPQTSLDDILMGALTEKESVGYNASFYYPKSGGIVTWLAKIAASLKNKIHTSTAAESINTKNKTITTQDGTVIPYEYLITTMPLDSMLKTLIEKPTLNCKKALKHLRCNSVLNFNIGISKPSITDKHWIYYPELKYPFYRLAFPHNFGDYTTPDNCSAISGEFAYLNHSELDLESAYKKSLSIVKKLFNFKKSDIITEKKLHLSHAFVTYNFWREKNLPKLLNKLEQESIHSVGRYGAWKYASMQEGILDGKSVVDLIAMTPAKVPVLTKKRTLSQPVSAISTKTINNKNLLK